MNLLYEKTNNQLIQLFTAFFFFIFPTQVTAKIPGTATSRPIDTAFGVGVCFIVYLTKMRYLPKKLPTN